MSVKVRCPKCQAEISDPADPKNVPCPACGIHFNSQPPSKVAWVLASILVACTLVAMWSTAVRVKARKLAARGGEKIEERMPPLPMPNRRLSASSKEPLDEFFSKAAKGETVDVEIEPGSPVERQRDVEATAELKGVAVRFMAADARPLRLQVRSGARLAVEHVALSRGPGGDTLSVTDARDRLLVLFTKLKTGEQRGWQEVRLTCVDVTPEATILDVELRPGASSFGAGRYASVRPGLRVEFGPQHSATVTAVDPAKQELTLKLESAGQTEELRLPVAGQGAKLGIRYGVGMHVGGRWELLLEPSE